MIKNLVSTLSHVVWKNIVILKKYFTFKELYVLKSPKSIFFNFLMPMWRVCVCMFVGVVKFLSSHFIKANKKRIFILRLNAD